MRGFLIIFCDGKVSQTSVFQFKYYVNLENGVRVHRSSEMHQLQWSIAESY
jgi:hypothetical protein